MYSYINEPKTSINKVKFKRNEVNSNTDLNSDSNTGMTEDIEKEIVKAIKEDKIMREDQKWHYDLSNEQKNLVQKFSKEFNSGYNKKSSNYLSTVPSPNISSTILVDSNLVETNSSSNKLDKEKIEKNTKSYNFFTIGICSYLIIILLHKFLSNINRKYKR